MVDPAARPMRFDYDTDPDPSRTGVLEKYGFGDDSITVHHLLTDLPGVPDYIQLLYGDDASVHEVIPQMGERFPMSLDELIDLFKDALLEFAPVTGRRAAGPTTSC